MKKLLSILLLFVTFGALAQTYDTLPTGSKPYGNFYLGPDGNLVFGNAGLKFRVIGTKKRVDSLLALKADLSQLALYQTKALLQQDLSPSSTGYPSINAVIGGLNSKANVTDLNSYQAKSEKGQSNGYAGLDGSGKVPLTQINDALLGAVNYRGTYDASTNSPALPAAASSNKGYYYIVSTAGTQFGLTFRVGDWIISNGSAYGKVASSSDVESVNGKKGVVNVDLNDVLTAGNSSEQAMGVGALITGSASVTSAPTQPSHVVRLDDISAGKTIGANAASATLWNGQTYLNTLRETPFSFMVNNSGTWGYTGTSQVKSALATSLQDVTNIGNQSNKLVQITGETTSIPLAKGLTLGYATSIDAGLISSYDYPNSTPKNLLLNPSGGNIGVGTTNATEKFTVAGNIQVNLGRLRADLGSSGSSLITTGTGSNFIVSHDGSSTVSIENSGGGGFNFTGDMKTGNTLQIGGNATIRRFSDSEIRIGDASDWRMTFLNGNVGIGTTNPIDKLDVNGDISNYSRSLRLSQEAGYTQLVAGVGKGHKFYTNDGQSQPLTLASDGLATFGGSVRVASNDGSSTAVARNVDLQGKANLIGGNSFTGNGVQNFIGTGDQRSTIQPGVFSVTNTASTAYSALGLYDLTVSAGTNQTSYKNGFINSNVTGTALSFDLPTVSGRLLTGIKTVVTLDFPNVAANQNATLQRTVANVAVNDVVTIGLPNSLMSTMTSWNGDFQVWVSAANTLSFRFLNNDPLAAHDLPDTTFTIFIHKQ